GRNGLALRHQEVAAVAGLHGDLVAEVAEIDDLLEKDQFHGVTPYSLAAPVAPQRLLSERTGIRGAPGFIGTSAHGCAGFREGTHTLWVWVYGIRARQRARLTAVAS